MRVKAILAWAAIVAAMLLASCSKSDDVAGTNEVSPVAVKAAFESQFPTATSMVDKVDKLSGCLFQPDINNQEHYQQHS